MPQPAANQAIAQELVDLWRATEEALTARIADAATSPIEGRRLRGLIAAVEQDLTALEAGTLEWVQGRLVIVYASGATAAAQSGELVWAQAHREAVQALAGQAWDDLLKSTRFVRRDTKRIVRGLARDSARQALLEGVTATRAGQEMAAQVRQATGAVTVRYRDGARHGIGDHSDTVARTVTANVYNEGTFVQADEDGFGWLEVFDGRACGWTSHDDPDLATGTVRTVADCREHPLSHPRCARSFAPAVDVTTAAAARRATVGTFDERAANAAAERARQAAQAPRFTVAQDRRRAARQARKARTQRTAR